MGQPVGVVEKPSSNPGIVRFETNRNLGSMGHTRFADYDQAAGQTPSAVLARRLFDTGKVAAVHVFSNVVTVSLSPGQTSSGLQQLVEGLYTYYVPGFVPPALEIPADVASEAPAAAGGDAGGSGVDSRVPAHLLEKSRAALAKWKATHGG
jgi:Scaffold protein Nfu/NifU N terminal